MALTGGEQEEEEAPGGGDGGGSHQNDETPPAEGALSPGRLQTECPGGGAAKEARRLLGETGRVHPRELVMALVTAVFGAGPGHVVEGHVGRQAGHRRHAGVSWRRRGQVVLRWDHVQVGDARGRAQGTQPHW